MSETRKTPVPDNLFVQQAMSPMPPTLPPPPTSPRQSNRICTAPQHLGYNNTQGHGYFASPSAWIFEENGIIFSPTSFKAAASDPDTLSFDQVMADIEHVTKWMRQLPRKWQALKRMELGTSQYA
jgi:hypothetical protein